MDPCRPDLGGARWWGARLTLLETERRMRRRKGLEAGLWAHPLGDRSARPAHCSSHLYFETKQSESQTLDGGVQHPPSCSQPVRCCTDNLRITSLQAFSKYLVVYVYLNGSMLSGPSPCPSPRFFGVASVPVFSKMTPGPCGGCFASESSCRWDQSIDKLSTPLRRLFWKDRAIAGAQSAGGGRASALVGPTHGEGSFASRHFASALPSCLLRPPFLLRPCS